MMTFLSLVMVTSQHRLLYYLSGITIQSECGYIKAQEQEREQAQLTRAYSIFISGLATYIIELKTTNDSANPTIFILADLIKLHKQTLKYLDIESTEVHATRL